jgi:hypothetical protein
MNANVKLSKHDARKLQLILDQNPSWTPAELARQIGRSEAALMRFMRRHEIKPGVRFAKKPMRANGLLGKVLGELERTYLQKQICDELQITRNRLCAWRLGHRDVPLSLFECLADLAGYRVVLEPVEENVRDAA